MLNLYSIGTTDAEVLNSIDTSSDTIPAQIFSYILTSNHISYENYSVQSSSRSGANATAQYNWQNLDTSLPAASVSFQQKDCVLSYDWSVMPYYVEIIFDRDTLTDKQLAAISKSIKMSL